MGGDSRMKYPILYASDTIDFFNLGLGVLKNTIRATVTEERNGSFYFEAEVLTDNAVFPLIYKDMIIKADAGHLLKDQRFRIKRIVPKHNGRAEIYAEHVSYLSAELSLKPEVGVSGNASQALMQWKAGIVEDNPFVVDSDITTSNSTKWRIDKVQNPRQALGGVEGSILDTWGGEYRFDNYHISLLKKRGTTANTVLAYGRNITDFEQEINITDTYTSITPFAIYTDDNEVERIVTVDGYVVDSQYAGNYPNRRTFPVDFSSEFEQGEIPTKAKLKQLADKYIKDNEVGVPKTSIKVSFLDLSKTADYAEYKDLEQVNLCDDVLVYYPKLGVNTVAKVIRTVWNVLTESYDEIEIGEKRMTLSSKIADHTKRIKELNTQTNSVIIAANGKNMIFYGLFGADGLGEPKATRVGDMWYKPNGEDTEFYIWNGVVWEFIMSTKETRIIGEKVDELEKEVQDAVDKSDKAVSDANQAVEDAGFAKNTASIAQSQAQTAIGNALTAKLAADMAANQATIALGKAGTVEGKITTVETHIDTINGELSGKVSNTEFSQLTGRVATAENSISVNTKAIELKANQTTVDTVAGRVTTAEGQLNTMAGQIQAKANQTTVDTISGKVSAAESTLTIQAGQIATLNTKTDTHTTQIGSLTSNYDGLRSSVSTVESDITKLGDANPNIWNPRIAQAGNIIGSTGNIGSSTTRIYMEYIPTNSQTHISAVCHERISGTDAWLGSIAFYDKDKNFITDSYTGLSNRLGEHQLVQVPVGAVYFRLAFDPQFKWKVEYGDKATPYTVGGGDDAVKVIQFSDFQQTVNGFQTTVNSSISGLQSQWTQLDRQITSVVGDIDNINNSDKLLIPYWERGTLSNTDGSELDSTFVARSPFIEVKEGDRLLYYFPDTGTLSSSWRYWYWYDKDKKFLSSGSTANAAKADVPAGCVYFRVRINTSSPLTEIRSNVIIGEDPIKIKEVNKSQFTQLQSAINLRAQKGNIIGEINVEAGKTILRQSDNVVMITPATTYIQNATIKSAHIESIVADKVTAGTLNAANVNIINLNVNKLVGNLTSFVQSSWNGISSQVSINSAGIDIGGASKAINLGASGMQIFNSGTAVGYIRGNAFAGMTGSSGLVFNLETASDYMAWSARDVSTDTNYTAKLVWMKRNSISTGGFYQGFTFTDPVRLRGGLAPHNDSGSRWFELQKTTTPSGVDAVRLAYCINDGYVGTGFVFNNGEVGLVTGGTYHPMTKAIKTAKVIGDIGSFYIPTAINSSGAVTKWVQITM